MAEGNDPTAPQPEDQDQSRESTPPEAEGVSGSPTPPPAAADEEAEALEEAVETVNSMREEAETATTSPPEGAAAAPEAQASSLDLPVFARNGSAESANGLELLAGVNLNVRIELGRTRMLVEDVLRLNEGSVVELDKLAGDPVDIYVNDRLVACGEVLVLNDAFSVRINDILGKPAAILRDLKPSQTNGPEDQDEPEQA